MLAASDGCGLCGRSIMAEKNNPKKIAFKKRPLGKSGMEVSQLLKLGGFLTR